MADVDLDQIHADPSMDNIEKLMAAMSDEPNEEIVEEQGEPVSAKVEEAEAVKEEEQVKQEAAPEEETPEGIATKSGKGIIPYNVLATERERRQQAEQALQQMQQRLNDMTQQTAGARQEASEVQFSDEDLAQISEDFPAVGKLFNALQAKLSATEAQLQQIREIELQRAEAEEATQRRAVNEAMDDNPALLFWRDKEPGLFDEAVRIDAQLQTNPRFSHLTLSDRFAKVVNAMEAIYGPTELPAEYQTRAVAQTPGKPQVSEKDLASRAKEVVAKASSTGRPRTLSDMPGGVAPISDDQKMESMNTSELADMFANKSPDEINALLARFA